MEKKKIAICVADYPIELHPFLSNAQIYDSSCSPNAQVLYSDLGYFIKIAEKNSLEKEAQLAVLFAEKGLGAEAMKLLHGQSTEGVPVSPNMEAYAGKLKCDTLIHGDFCLPNVMFADGKFSAFIDLGLAGVGDKHIDIYWVLWSLNYNLKTDKYTDYFLDLYGRENVDMEVLKIVAEVEN